MKIKTLFRGKIQADQPHNRTKAVLGTEDVLQGSDSAPPSPALRPSLTESNLLGTFSGESYVST